MSFEIESQNAFALREKAITLTTSRRRSIQILKWRSINFAAKYQLPLEEEQVPNPTRRPGPEEKLAVNNPNAQYYPGSNLSKTCELFGRLDRAQKKVVYTRLE